VCVKEKPLAFPLADRKGA